MSHRSRRLWENGSPSTGWSYFASTALTKTTGKSISSAPVKRIGSFRFISARLLASIEGPVDSWQAAADEWNASRPEVWSRCARYDLFKVCLSRRPGLLYRRRTLAESHLALGELGPVRAERGISYEVRGREVGERETVTRRGREMRTPYISHDGSAVITSCLHIPPAYTTQSQVSHQQYWVDRRRVISGDPLCSLRPGSAEARSSYGYVGSLAALEGGARDKG